MQNCPVSLSYNKTNWGEPSLVHLIKRTLSPALQRWRGSPRLKAVCWGAPWSASRAASSTRPTSRPWCWWEVTSPVWSMRPAGAANRPLMKHKVLQYRYLSMNLCICVFIFCGSMHLFIDLSMNLSWYVLDTWEIRFHRVTIFWRLLLCAVVGMPPVDGWHRLFLHFYTKRLHLERINKCQTSSQQGA